MKYLLIEDECAPDSYEFFNKKLKKITGYSIKDFKEKGNKIKYGYILNNYKIEYFPDEPLWHLSKI